MIEAFLIDDFTSWQSFAAQWNHMARGHFMMSMDWLVPWWNHLSLRRPLRRKLSILAVMENGTPIGFAPLCSENTPLFGWQLEWLGSGKACSDNMTLLALNGKGMLCAEACASYLERAGIDGEWDRIQLDGVQPNRTINRQFQSNMEQRGMAFYSRQGPSCWSIDIRGGWERYLSSLSKRSRKLVRDQVKTYIDSGMAQIEQPTTLSEAHQHLEVIADLHQARWRSKGIEGCFSRHEFRAFLDEIVERFFSNGLFLRLLRLKDEPVAGVLGFQCDQTLHCYLVGMSTNRLECRPGWTLNICILQHAMAQGLRTIDLMRGDEDYKERLGATPTIQEKWIASAPRVLPRMRHAAFCASAWIKDTVNENGLLQELAPL